MMANDKDDHDDFIVVTDGSPKIGVDGEDLTPAPATSSKSPGKSPSTERPRRPARLSSQRRSDGSFNDTLDPLRALPELRPIPWYVGKELSTEKSTESTRVQTRGACLLASRGNVNDPPCNHCKSGVGRFSVCISLEGWFHGACATCQLATRGNLCSLRTNKDSRKLASGLPYIHLLTRDSCQIRERARRISSCRGVCGHQSFKEYSSYPTATEVQ